MKLTVKRLPKVVFAQIYTRNRFAHRIVAMLPGLTLDRPIFILGLPRSGTSIFTTLFGENRNVAHWSEAAMVWDPVWRSWENEHRWTAEAATRRAIRRINNNFGYYTKSKGCTRFVNKHPRNALRVPFLNAGWPDARLVLIQRDARAVANSLYEISVREKHRDRFPLGGFARPEGWREINALEDRMERFATMTRVIHDTLMTDLGNEADPTRIIEVRYEDFAQDVQGTIRQVCEFCDVPIDDRALEHTETTLENRNFKWATKRTDDEIRTLHRLLSPALMETGYEPDDSWLDRVLAERAGTTPPPTSEPVESTEAANTH